MHCTDGCVFGNSDDDDDANSAWSSDQYELWHHSAKAFLFALHVVRSVGPFKNLPYYSKMSLHNLERALSFIVGPMLGGRVDIQGKWLAQQQTQVGPRTWAICMRTSTMATKPFMRHLLQWHSQLSGRGGGGVALVTRYMPQYVDTYPHTRTWSRYHSRATYHIIWFNVTPPP